MGENDNTLVVQAYSLPAWLKVKIEDEARMNERTASAELRVRLAASFGLRTDGMPLAEHSSAIKAGGDARGPEDGAAPRLDDEATGGPGDEA